MRWILYAAASDPALTGLFLALIALVMAAGPLRADDKRIALVIVNGVASCTFGSPEPFAAGGNVTGLFTMKR